MLNSYPSEHTHPNRTPNGTVPASRTLLLVEPDAQRAERMEQHLTLALPGLVTMRCGTLASARAYLSGNAFDVVCTAEELPDGSGPALLAFRDALGLRAPVFVWPRINGPEPIRAPAVGVGYVRLDGADVEEAAAAIGRALTLREDIARLDWGGDALGLLEAFYDETGLVAHAINNPLTVIAGNAQLLGELARLNGMDPALARPVADIEAAAQQLGEVLKRLAVLRQHLAVALGITG